MTSTAADDQGGPLTALVIGGGVAGLLAAHVACQRFSSVYLVEGDKLERGVAVGSAAEALHGSKAHRGIPQYMQPHTLAMGGLHAMDRLLPGFHDEIVRRGGVPLDFAKDIRFFDFGAPNIRCDSSLQCVGTSRHLIQSTLQDEVLGRNAGRLEVRDGCRVSGLLWSKDTSTVEGVELSSGERLTADVVIMAAGRSSRLPQWMAAAGHAVPSTQKVDAGLTYVGRLYRVPAGFDRGWKGHITYGRPDGLRGAGMVPVEGDTWQMAVWGVNGLVPPTDEEGFHAFARSLPDPEIAEAIAAAEPLTPLVKYGGAYNIQRHWEQVSLPAGLLVIGDAVQALNPVYAQGMSVASMSALALDQALEQSLAGAPDGGARRTAVRGMGPAFQRRLAGVIAPAWQMATSEDLRYPGTKAEGVARPPRLVSAYLDALFRACHCDGRAMEIFFSIAHMTRPAHHIFHPRLLAAAAAEALRSMMAALAALLPQRTTAPSDGSVGGDGSSGAKLAGSAKQGGVHEE